jgi:hypothetical protein
LYWINKIMKPTVNGNLPTTNIPINLTIPNSMLL